jgi:hypothetical protein
MRVPGFMSAKVSIWQVLVLNAITLVMVAVTVVGVTVVGASGLDSFRPIGSIRMANSYSTTTKTVAGADGDTAILSVQFTVPSGKVADIQVTYQGQIHKATTSLIGLCFGELRLDSPTGSVLAPGQQLLLDGGVLSAGGAVHEVSASLQGRKNSIPSGSHRVYFVASTGGVGCAYGDRSLFVVADIHGA